MLSVRGCQCSFSPEFLENILKQKTLKDSRHLAIMLTYLRNHDHNILRLFDILSIFPFTKS